MAETPKPRLVPPADLPTIIAWARLHPSEFYNLYMDRLPVNERIALERLVRKHIE